MRTRAECTAEDTPAVLAFLERYVETSLFLIANVQSSGITTNGPAYVMAREGDAIVGIVSVNANGILLLQAPEEAASLAAFAIARSSRSIAGILGPTEQADEVLDGCGFRAQPARMHSDEQLYSLDLRTFSVGMHILDSHVRLAAPDDAAALTALRRAYLIEALGAVDDAALDVTACADAERMSNDGATFVLVDGDTILAMTSFSARFRDVVQVGGVFTPPASRSRGYGRAVVAGSLEYAKRAWGAARAVLFTAASNVPAQRAYEALGFVRKGRYTLHFFREPIRAEEAMP